MIGLFDHLPQAAAAPVPRRKLTIEERFAVFDAANPHVWELFQRFAGQLLAAGRTRYSADAILHRIRWEFAVQTAGDDEGFRINDHFSSRYARKLAAADARFADFFEFRTLHRE